MKKHIILLGTLVLSTVAYSQVGINTETPKATLDVVASPNKPALIDGFIAPRLKGTELKAKDALYTTDQIGTLVYVTEALDGNSSTPATEDDVTAKTINVTQPGYYSFDGTKWVMFLDANTDNNHWIDGPSAGEILLKQPSSNYTTKYFANGGYIQYDEDDFNFPIPSTPAANAPANQSILGRNSFTKSLIKASDIDLVTSNGYVTKNTNIFKVDVGSSELGTGEIITNLNSAIVEPTVTDDIGVMSGAFTNVEHWGSGNVGNIRGLLASGAVNGVSSKAGTVRGGIIDATSNSNESITTLTGLLNRIRLNGNGSIANVVANDATIGNRVTANKSGSNIGNMFIYRGSYNTLVPANFTGTITNAYDFYATAGTGVNITNRYGVFIDGVDKKNYLAGSLTVGYPSSSDLILNPTAKFEIGNNSARIAGRYYHRTTTANSNPAGFKEIITMKDNGSTFLETNRTYTVVLNTHSLTFNTDSKWIVYYDNVLTAWQVKLVSGKTHPSSTKLELAPSGKELQVYHGWPSETYMIRANIESIDNYSEKGTSSFNFGLDGVMTRLDDNVGVGTTTPTQKLEVDGAIKIGTTSTASATPGTIRYNSTTDKFQGYTSGSGWVDLH